MRINNILTILIISVMVLLLSCVVLGQAAVVRDFKWVHNFLATCPSKHFTWKFTLCVVLNQNVCPHASSYQWQWPGFEIEHELNSTILGHSKISLMVELIKKSYVNEKDINTKSLF